ncbi:inactive receptor kinase [Pyrus ussuriensis x Pyrus communis]|uniref:Inactive receptor kinase n=1 Tax=Pyrus ussuriensis x Pyrus communis TaxID=2448454 RepID=A0A5N5HKY2_9ROSA|nr:inactive receptor kinase [Pyrus ussuriensis x Pyrus communis]
MQELKLVEGVEGLVVEVGLGFEGQEGDYVGGWEEEVWRRRWEWKGSAGVDGGGDKKEVEDEKIKIF